MKPNAHRGKFSGILTTKKMRGCVQHKIEDNGDITERTLRKVYLAYEEACTRAGLVDFAELLLRSHELWLSDPALLQHYQQRFQHILIDEFQDTNTIQYAWISLLTTPATDLMIVGDDDQSIYGWRGAKIENIHQFERDFQNVKLIRLEQNYRSTHMILQAANALIKHNDARLGKNLWTEGEQGEKLSLYSAYNERDEATHVINCIRQCISKGIFSARYCYFIPIECAIRVLEEALLQASMSYRVYGGMRFFERAEIKNALAYLRLSVNQQDDAAFERIVNFPTRGIGDRSLMTVRDIACARHLSLWQAAKAVINESLLTARACNAIHKFIDIIDKISIGLHDINLAEKIEQVIDVSGLLQHYEQERTETARARVENIEELISVDENRS